MSKIANKEKIKMDLIRQSVSLLKSPEDFDKLMQQIDAGFIKIESDIAARLYNKGRIDEFSDYLEELIVNLVNTTALAKIGDAASNKSTIKVVNEISLKFKELFD